MEKRGGFYALVRLFGRFWVWFFFREVDVQHAERVLVQRRTGTSTLGQLPGGARERGVAVWGQLGQGRPLGEA